ncbi:MAG: hypothetical protein NC089_08610 [Bacteroides sp.]|nr:hypothetical protein [Bacteroides sp.]MCM1549851.1 hypothetical protein [Clostridium sp.]
MMQLDRLTLGRMAKELGFVRDTLEKVYRLADVLKFMESDELLSKRIALKGGTAINLTILICQGFLLILIWIIAEVLIGKKCL